MEEYGGTRKIIQELHIRSAMFRSPCDEGKIFMPLKKEMDRQQNNMFSRMRFCIGVCYV